MKKILPVVTILVQTFFCCAQNKITQLPVLKHSNESLLRVDWLIHKTAQHADVYQSEDGKNIILN